MNLNPLKAAAEIVGAPLYSIASELFDIKTEMSRIRVAVEANTKEVSQLGDIVFMVIEDDEALRVRILKEDE